MYNLIFAAQTSAGKAKKTTQEVPSKAPQNAPPPIFMFTSGGLLLAVIALVAYGKYLKTQLDKKLKFEQFRTRELEKKFKLALETIRKMETNPDLVNSRDFNLDYLRMRMAEEVFHFAIVNQIKIQVKRKNFSSSTSQSIPARICRDCY